VTNAVEGLSAPTSGRQQVLLGAMQKLTADLVKQAIGHLDLEFVNDSSKLRPAGTGPPPIVIAALEERQARAWSRDVLQTRPEAILLQVERDGRELSVRALYPSHDRLGVLNAQQLVHAIATASPWDERFST
jgi:hypothetical protein